MGGVVPEAGLYGWGYQAPEVLVTNLSILLQSNKVYQHTTLLFTVLLMNKNNFGFTVKSETAILGKIPG